jgi:hypothetical protein
MMPPPMLATVTTYAPTRCGIARFSASLLAELQGLGTRVDVVRLVQPGETPAAPGSGVVFEFDPGSSLSVEIARHRLQRYDGVVIQHEFGIYGPDHGSSVVDLLEELKPASVVVLHTVLTKPRAEERRITHALADRATVLVVPSHSARILLEDEYGIPAEQVTVIPHGSAWQPAPRPARPIAGGYSLGGCSGPARGSSGPSPPSPNSKTSTRPRSTQSSAKPTRRWHGGRASPTATACMRWSTIWDSWDRWSSTTDTSPMTTFTVW